MMGGGEGRGMGYDGRRERGGAWDIMGGGRGEGHGDMIRGGRRGRGGAWNMI